MKLRKFIKKLEEIKKKQGENLEVVMADNIPIIEPIFLEQYCGNKVVITDQK